MHGSLSLSVLEPAFFRKCQLERPETARDGRSEAERVARLASRWCPGYVSSLRSVQAASSQPLPSVIVDGVHYRLSLLGLQTKISVEVTSLGTLDQGMEADPVARTMRRIRQEAIREVDTPAWPTSIFTFGPPEN